MPIGAWAHRQYWVTRSTVVPPPSSGGAEAGYTRWQSVPISMNTGLAGLWDPLVEVAAWVWAVCAGLLGALGMAASLGGAKLKHKHALRRSVDVMNDPRYTIAVDCVAQTATTLGFRRPQAWSKLSHALKEKPHWAENSWRHLHACKLLDEAVRAQGSTLSNPEMNLMVELAYAEYQQRNRYH